MFDDLGQKHKKIILTVFYTALICFLLYILFKYVFIWLAPFILAYLFASMAEPVVRFIIKKFRAGRKLAAVLSMFICFCFLYTLLYLLINRAIYEIKKITASLPDLIASIPTSFDNMGNSLFSVLNSWGFSIEIQDHIGNLLTPIFEQIPQTISSHLQGTTLNLATDMTSAVPGIFIFIIAFLVSSFFIISDRQKISDFLMAQFPPAWQERILKLKSHLLATLVNYLKALFILLSITFIELLVGFSIIGIDYALTLAFLIAIIDAVPILGTGTVLIPWALASLLQTNYRLAISLLVLYGVVTVVRQILEPKIVGSSIGLYPLITLISIYVGYRIMGFPGMFVGPFTCIFLKFLQESGILPLYKLPTKKERPK